jgi:hypothetical protein
MTSSVFLGRGCGVGLQQVLLILDDHSVLLTGTLDGSRSVTDQPAREQLEGVDKLQKRFGKQEHQV